MFYCLLKTGCRNFTDSSGVYIYCSNPYTASDSFSIASLREPISHPLHLRFKDMMSVSAVGWVLMAPWCASEIKFQDQKKKLEFSSRERKKINFLCFILASEFKLVSDEAGLSSVRVCDNWHLGFQVPSGGRRVYWFLRLPSSAPILGCLFNREEELLNGCFLVQNVSSRYTGISLSWSVSLSITHTHTHTWSYIYWFLGKMYK